MDGDSNHEIKRRLLLEKKPRTNIDSILKSRDITLLTKICIIKAMFLPVIMCVCERLTTKTLNAKNLMTLSCDTVEDY